MNKSPINYLLTAATGVILWVIFAILLGSYLSENPNLSDKDPTDLAGELRIIFGLGVLLSIISACYWFYYGSLEKTAGDLNGAKSKWRNLFIFQIVLSVALTLVIILTNISQGIEAKWFCLYFAILALLTFILFWITTYLMSPRTVKFIPLGKK